MTIKTAILSISTRGSRGTRPEDISAQVIREILVEGNYEVVSYQIIPDDKKLITDELKHQIESDVELILTTGGTGLSPNDVTPEATLAVIDRRLPGFEEVMRATGFAKTPYAILSRAVCGTSGKTLIINLPGNPKGVRENLSAVITVIPHGIKVLRADNVQDDEHAYRNEDKG